jgi:hypothetical protein
MPGLQVLRKSGVHASTVLITAFMISGCYGVETAAPTATPESVASSSEKRGTRTGPITISQIITDNGRPTGLQLGEREILHFSTPGSKLYTDGLAFQSAVSEGLGGFLITPNVPTWINLCEPAGTLPEGLNMEQPELFTPHWHACRLGDNWAVISASEVSSNREALKVWLAVPVQPKWESELQQVEWSLELTVL